MRDGAHVRLTTAEAALRQAVAEENAATTALAQTQQRQQERQQEDVKQERAQEDEEEGDAAESSPPTVFGVLKEIGTILKRHHTQAEGLGFQGTPSFIIGKFRLFGAREEEVFKQAIADARKALNVK